MANAAGALWDFVISRVLEFDFVLFGCKVVSKATPCFVVSNYVTGCVYAECWGWDVSSVSGIKYGGPHRVYEIQEGSSCFISGFFWDLIADSVEECACGFIVPYFVDCLVDFLCCSVVRSFIWKRKSGQAGSMGRTWKVIMVEDHTLQ